VAPSRVCNVSSGREADSGAREGEWPQSVCSCRSLARLEGQELADSVRSASGEAVIALHRWIQ